MVRIAQVNIFLHQFKNPKIFQYDTLSMEERWRDKFDVIMANPPFMSPKGGIKAHNKFSVKSTRSEVLFVDYIMNHLKPKGRAGIIVPEGIIFQSGTTYKQLRKNLIQDGLYGVVSLPSGIFQPYSGVKTSVLLFDNELARQSQELLFIKVEADGYDLGAQRRPNSKNDLPKALEIIHQWQQGKKTEHPLALFVEKSQIAENGDYNLSGDRYRIATDYSNTKWPMVKLGEVCETFTDGDWIESKDQSHSGIRLIQTGNVGTGEFLDKGNKARYISEETFRNLKCTEIFPNDILISRLPDPVGRVCIVPDIRERMITAVDCTIVRFQTNKVLHKFFNYYAKSGNYFQDLKQFLTGASRQRISKSHLSEIQIPIPPLEIQQQVVAELDGYQNIIQGAQQIVKNWKPTIDIDPEWKKVKLGEVCDIYGGGTPSRTTPEFWDGDIPWISSKYFTDDHRIYGNEYITKIGLEKSSSRIAPKDSTILITRVSVGKYAIADKDYAINQDLTVLVVKDNSIDYRFLWLVSGLIAEKIKTSATGIGVVGVTRDFVVNQEIPLPSLEIQQQIVERIEAERILVESAKKLITLYTQKISTTLAKLWEE
jgi:type I restriction enzyme M protein